MLWANINRDKKEWSFGNFYNATSSALAKGSWVVFDLGTQVNGNRVIQPVTANFGVCVGVSIEAVAATDYGRFQTYGYCAEALVTNHTATAIVAGDSLGLVDSANHLVRLAAGGTDSLLSVATAAEAVAINATPAAALVKVFVQTLTG